MVKKMIDTIIATRVSAEKDWFDANKMVYDFEVWYQGTTFEVTYVTDNVEGKPGTFADDSIKAV
jgi:hypothetical protein